MQKYGGKNPTGFIKLGKQNQVYAVLIIVILFGKKL